MTRISFIVPTFNRAGFLGEALAAIVAQMDDGDELLVVDDGSTDSTAEVVRQAGARAGYIRQDNAGKAVALNRALARTTGEFVWICDDDDILRPGAVAAIHDTMETSGAAFAFGRYTRFRDLPDGRREDLGTGYWPDLSRGSLVRHILEDAFVMQNAALVRRSAYEAVGPFSEAMPRSLDYEMFVRLAVSQPCAYVDRIVFDQRKHDGARGPASLLHSASSVDGVWQKLDQLIFENLHAFAPIDWFAGFFETDERILAQRAALLLRGSIMARHGCWEQALDDFEAAARLPGPPLCRAETEVCRRALAGKHRFGALCDQRDWLARFRDLAKLPAGAAIRHALLFGTRWRLLRGDWEGRIETLRLFRQSHGWGALLPGPVKSAGHALQERNALPADMLLPAGRVPPVGATVSRGLA